VLSGLASLSVLSQIGEAEGSDQRLLVLSTIHSVYLCASHHTMCATDMVLVVFHCSMFVESDEVRATADVHKARVSKHNQC
jgi:hypothetical protein